MIVGRTLNKNDMAMSLQWLHRRDGTPGFTAARREGI
jgi:hypothetical protein